LKAAEFAAVLEHRCAVRSRYFQVMGRPNDRGHARLGMIVSKRLFSRAVDRNRIRRLIREAFRLSAPALPALDLVVRPYSHPVGGSPAEDLRLALDSAAVKCSIS
jgi:ribonuclease P protein component